ncbi:DUF3570 domain-containing protein [Flavimarina sp. Hel_I_48]|uniref:DUF3570 domain-containing protein n=1 Tax=Flavimarina sp. Hel_I_48 TaxID=1392488 RepID=UPI0004DF967C|nr:DUF3570 domain-containing protein [Flavimarina sp. Hel_I_48]
MNKYFLLLICLSGGINTYSQAQDSTSTYKRRVLENTEVDLLASYYSQSGNSAAVTGGRGTEELTDVAPSIVVSIPLNADDVLSIDANISAYTSASSSNIDPFDGNGPADPFVSSSGASSSDVWTNVNVSYSHSSDDRDKIWSANVSLSNEYDYFSVGFGGNYTHLFNEKNTELSVKGNIFLDSWKPIYPIELRPFAQGQNGLANALFSNYKILGNANYQPRFDEFQTKSRNTYALGLTFSQILSKKLQGALELDLVHQEGLLSTPFQRVYFQDIENSFIENFQLADAIELLPDTRFKIAVGGRLNYYINELFVLRSYYRYYTDDWGIRSHTASLEVPIKVAPKFTIYPSYRYYTQTASDYFAGYESHLSTEAFYTSDYDLSNFNANQYGFGATYTDIFTKIHIWELGLKSIDLKYNRYARNSKFKADIIAVGFKFIMD